VSCRIALRAARTVFAPPRCWPQGERGDPHLLQMIQTLAAAGAAASADSASKKPRVEEQRPS